MTPPPVPPPKLDVVASGTQYELGVAQGRTLRERIRQSRAVLKRLEAFASQKPWWMPYPAFLSIAEWSSQRHLGRAFRSEFPTEFDRMRGVADGSGLPFRSVALLNVLEPMLAAVGDCTVSLGGCSAIAVRGSMSASGEPIIARNFDYLPLVQPYYVLRDVRPEGKLRSVEFTAAPLAGAVDGLNEAGLAITYDYAFTTDEPERTAPPISLVISAVLAECRTVAEAVKLFDSRRRWGAGLLMLADADGDIASLELSSTRCAVRRPEGETTCERDVIHHTNAFRQPETRAVQVADEAVYSDRAPQPMRGKPLHRSSQLRDARFDELLHGRSELTTDDLQQIMGDHGTEAAPGGETLCVHSDYWYTTASVQMLPAQRAFRIAYSTTCEAEYETFTVGEP